MAESYARWVPALRRAEGARLGRDDSRVSSRGDAVPRRVQATRHPPSPKTAPPKPGAIFLYFSPLTLLVYLALPHAYLLDIATSYMLKDQLHASATEVSMFRLLTAIPVYLSFVFGLTRDLWNPFGLKDRGYFLLFASATAAVYLWMASSTL